MGFAQAIQNSDARKTLFHYTSQKGLMGIIKSKSIWATHLYHLNDSTEFVYAFDLMNQKISNMRERVVNTFDIKANLYRAMEQELQTYRKLPSHLGLYVCSFSEDGDLLSQWRGYCPDGVGYSIGFSIGSLEDAAKDQKFTLQKCIYDPKEQDRLLSKIFNNVTVQIDKLVLDSSVKGGYDESKFEDIMTSILIIPLVFIAPLLKNHMFNEEKEWRLVSSSAISNIKYRNGKSAIIPYYDFRLSRPDAVMDVNEIKISPSMNSRLAVESLSNYLKSENVTVKNISPSKIPYRGY